MLEGHEDASWLPSSVTFGNGMILEWLATEDNFSAIQLQNCIQMLLDPLVVPGENWSNSEVIEASLGCLFLHLVEEVSLAPVPVHEHDGLGGALLTGVSISILVASVGDKVDV